MEGSGEIPDTTEVSPKNDPNVYKRIAEFCLDINEIRQDQLVHQLTLQMDVDDLEPKPSPLQHTLRQCDISGFEFEDDIPLRITNQEEKVNENNKRNRSPDSR